VFASEPCTDSPLFEFENVVVTPHLGASTQKAQDRAGLIVAEQVAAALTGGFVSNAVNVPHVRSEEMEVLGPFLPLATNLGRLAAGLATSGVQGLGGAYAGALGELDTRLLTSAVLAGAFAGNVEEHVNLVNARSVAEGRGILVTESARARAATSRT